MKSQIYSQMAGVRFTLFWPRIPGINQQVQNTVSLHDFLICHSSMAGKCDHAKHIATE